MKEKNSVYVRYLYTTKKGLKTLEAMSEGTDEFIIQKIPTERGPPPMPPKSFVGSKWILAGVKLD